MSEESTDKNSHYSEIKYNKDSVFDKFDITDLINNDLLIPKIPNENFFYQNELQNFINNINNSQNSTISSTKDKNNLEEIISKINNNNFGINIDELILTFPNDYKIPFIDLYTPIELIGQGGFGVVISVIDSKKNKKMAVKIILKTSHKEEFYLIEAELLQKLNHEKILKFYDVINTENYLFIFTDLCEGGSLKDFIISRYNNKENYFIKDSESSTIIKNILQGIEYLSQNGVIHRDLKPENIMFKKKNDLNSLVICDLGIAGEMKNIYSFMDMKCGTLTFMAPEIIMDRQYDNLVDIWSTGIIMYILESGGAHPLLYESKYKSEYIEDIKSKKNFFFPNHFPLIARNIFLKMCKYEPCFRYNVTKSLNHPWITRQNINIPLTVIEDLQKEDKIKTFKEMLITMVFLKQYKEILNIKTVEIENESENINESCLIKRKLNIKKENIDFDIYPSPHNLFSIQRRKKSISKRELPLLSRPSSKNECNNKFKGILRLKSFNTDKKKSIRYSIYSKNSIGAKSKKNINDDNNIKIRNISNFKLTYKKAYTKSCFESENLLFNKNINKKLASIGPDNYLENNCQQIGTPISSKKKSFRNHDNNKYLTAKMMRNKENLNYNCWNNLNCNGINNYTNKKSNNNIFFKIPSKNKLIEPRNLFHKSNNNQVLKNTGSDIIKKIF